MANIFARALCEQAPNGLLAKCEPAFVHPLEIAKLYCIQGAQTGATEGRLPKKGLPVWGAPFFGAGDGNRTRSISLGS